MKRPIKKQISLFLTGWFFAFFIGLIWIISQIDWYLWEKGYYNG